MTDPETFAAACGKALEEGRFVRLTLSGYKGAEEGLNKIIARPVILKGTMMAAFTYRYKTRDIAKNYTPAEAALKITAALSDGFRNGTLFTTGFDLSYPSLKKGRATHPEKPDAAHDRAKNRHVETLGKPYLRALKITDAQGNVLPSAQDKYRQIDKYVETLAAPLRDLDKSPLEIVDMGAGKGYLTFALYDYLRNTQGRDVRVTGVEYRQDMVDLCNGVAAKAGFDGLSFVKGTIADYAGTAPDVLIALHACDTATDDAIAKGIREGASLIVVAPCCHKQIRREMEAGAAPHALDFLLRHGVFMERQAEMVTDAIRAMILEYHGYTAKAFEFVSDRHTPKNVMITGVKNPRAKPRPELLEKIAAARASFGIGHHYLEKILDL